MIELLAFYLFAAVTVLSGVMVISARNPVHGVLFLILAFFSAAGLFVLLGAEFLAMILVIVYVGAVAVLFLFVVMMLDVDFESLRQGIGKAAPVAGVVGVVLLVELMLMGARWHVPAVGAIADPIQGMGAATNTEMLGRLIYSDYVYLFQAAGMILLVAMIGAIVLTLRHRPDVRRQAVPDQLERRREQVLSLRQPPLGGGIEDEGATAGRGGR